MGVRACRSSCSGRRWQVSRGRPCCRVGHAPAPACAATGVADGSADSWRACRSCCSTLWVRSARCRPVVSAAVRHVSWAIHQQRRRVGAHDLAAIRGSRSALPGQSTLCGPRSLSPWRDCSPEDRHRVHDSVHVAPQHGTWTRSLRPHDMEKPQVRADDPSEPPTGFEPVNYALREARDSAPGALPAQIASHVRRTAPSAQHAPYSGPRPGPRPGQLSVTERYWPEWHWPQGLPVNLW